MREIKFRGCEVVGNARKLSGWVYGDLVHYCGGYERTVDDEITPVVTEICIECADCLHTVDPDTVGQFTGLKDCGGKEIYEGDIVKYFDTDEPWIVGYEVDFGRLIISSAKDKYSNYGAFGLKDSKMVTVIGNVHDSPELLEDSNGRL